MASQIARALPAGVSFFKPPKEPDDRQRRRGLKRAGKKTLEWETIRAELKQRFAAVGIKECELRFDGCWTDDALGFAHAKKRRNCRDRDLYTVILACNTCHDKIEVLPEKEMTRKVLSVIANRKVQP